MDIDIYTLAHEIKNPLSIAKGYLEMSNEKNFSKYMEKINDNIEEALGILDNYLEFNKLSINNEIFDLIMLIEEINSNYNALFKASVEIISLYEELFINGDYYKLKQVFNNLIKNSIEAHSTNIKVYIKIVDEYIYIKLVDNGDGFNNLDNLEGYSKKVNGNGIGLKITKKIIELHDGLIEYANNLDNGCNVVIKLPIKL